MNHGTEKIMATAKKTTTKKTAEPKKVTKAVKEVKAPAKKKREVWTKAEITPELQDHFQEALGNKPKSQVWPKVVKGNHLTVTTHENGKTELVWDDEALLKEVRDAIMAYELDNLKPAVKAKAVTRAKKLKT